MPILLSLSPYKIPSPISLCLRHKSPISYHFPLASLAVIVILMLDLWLAKDNRFLNPKSSYERILSPGPVSSFHFI